MISFDFNKHCYGCGACENICPANSIKLVPNNEGFLMPQFDNKLCVNCSMCEKICPYANYRDYATFSDTDEAFYAYRKDRDDYRKYTSSGVFSALAIYVLKEGGYVSGCIWNEELQAEHIVTQDVNLIRKMAYSKYVQSSIGNCYSKIKKILQLNHLVLFSGTPCQVAGLLNFLGKDYENLLTCGIVCHGTPSPLIWEKYKGYLSKKHCSKMINANFRYKGKHGWITPYTQYKFNDGKTIEKLSFTDDPYVIAFGYDILHRNSCYNCQFKGTKSNADFILGDYWGCPDELINKSQNRGISAIIIHTRKGRTYWESICNKFEYGIISIESITKENSPVEEPVKYNKMRETVFQRMDAGDKIQDILAVSTSKTVRIKKILYRLRLFETLKRIKYRRSHR